MFSLAISGRNALLPSLVLSPANDDDTCGQGIEHGHDEE
jgi:hypothetical protein